MISSEGQLAGYQIGNFLLAFEFALTTRMLDNAEWAERGVR
jgi:hypothetical protein